MDLEHIPTYGEYKARRIAEKAKARIQRPIYAPAYDPSQEADPDHEWFRLQRDHKHKEVHDIVSLVTDITSKARTGDRELLSLHKSADTTRDISLAANIEVALVGQQGMGKSLMINALTNRRDLSKTSARFGACTASAIKYQHKHGVNDKHGLFDAVIKFMDDEGLHEIISEHVRRYKHFYYSGNVDPEYWYEEQRAAETAAKFFEEIFNARFDSDAKALLASLLEETSVVNGELLRAAMQMARDRIDETCAGEQRAIYFGNTNIDQLTQAVNYYVSDAEEQSSLWPIVHDVIVYMGSTLARNGVVMVDLPGLGDLNQSRTAATNAVRRKAMFELIVAKSERVVTEEVVDQQVRQSIRTHGAKNTILVMTQIDQYFLDTHSVDNEIKRSQIHPFPTIQQYRNETENMLEKFDIDCGEEDSEEIEHMEAYRSHLTELAQCAFVKQRAYEIEQRMCERFRDEDPDPIKVFSVSASMYLDWIKIRQKDRPALNPEMTGIPVLRRFLLGLSAEGNYRAYKEHVKTKLSMFLDKIRRIVQEEKKDDSYAIIRPRFQELTTRLNTVLEAAFDSFVNNRVDEVWKGKAAKEERHASLLKIVSEWGNGVAWNTYAKLAREKGIVARTQAKKYVQPDKRFGSVNWNEEMSAEILPDMKSWKHRMYDAVTSLACDLDRHVLNTCNEIIACITGSEVAEDVKEIAVEEWNQHQERIITQSKKYEKILRNSIRSTYKFATTETDIRCMLAKVNSEAYTMVEETLRGAGFSQAQRDRMYTTMKEPDQDGRSLPDRISLMVRKEAKKNLRNACNTILEKFITELQLFDKHIEERLPADYVLSRYDYQLRYALKNLLPHLEGRVKQLVGELSSSGITNDHVDGSEEHGVAEPSKIGSKTRREDIEETTPAKKVKINDWLQDMATSKVMQKAPTNPKGEEGKTPPRFKSEGLA